MSCIIMKKRIKQQENLIDKKQLTKDFAFIIQEHYIVITYVIDEKIKLKFLNGQTFTIEIQED